MNKNKGITLLALIITIIIMLILAGVTISIVGGSDGIIAKAEKAVSQTDKAAMQEDAELSIAAIKMDYYEDYGVNRTKYANAKAFIVEKLKTAYTTSRGATMVADSEGNVTYTYKSVATKLTLGDDGSVSLEESTAGGTVTPDEPEVPVIPNGLKVGDTVSYYSNGTYMLQGEYVVSGNYITGTDILLNSATGEEFNVESWKVFSIDESTGEIELIATAPTAGTITFAGIQGYNNGVKLLNDACSNLYGDSSKGITARSINRDDLDNIMYYEKEEMNFIEYCKTYYPPDSFMDENYQVINAYTNSTYPTIYEQEDLSTITYYGNTTETKVAKGTGLGRSEQTEFIGKSAKGAVSGETSSNGYITTAKTIRPYRTFFGLDNTTFTTLLRDYASLVLPKGTNTSYWIASRYIIARNGGCDFGIESVAGGGIVSYFTGNVPDQNAMLPIVSLKANLLSGNSTDGWEVK